MATKVLTTSIKTQISTWYQKLQQQLADFSPRPAQRQMIAEVAKTFSGEQGRHLAIEAPTGIGKTLSYLIAGLAVAQAQQKTLIVSTANVALQDQIYNKDLPLLKQIIPDFSFTVAVGRRRYICPRNLYFTADTEGSQADLLWQIASDDSQSSAGQSPQSQQLCMALQNNLDNGSWDGVRDHYPEPINDELWLRLSTDKMRCLAHHCQWYRQCPFFINRRQIEHADVVITNHALVLAALESESVLPPAAKMLLVMDEGHHLPEIARDTMESSADISVSAAVMTFESFIKLLVTLQGYFTIKITTPLANIERLTEHCQQLSALLLQLQQQFEPLLHQQGEKHSYRFVMGELPEAVLDAARQLARGYQSLHSLTESLLNAIGELTGKADIVRIQQSLLQLNRFLALYEAMLTLWRLAVLDHLSGAPVCKWLTLENRENQQKLYFHCAGIRVSEQLEKRLWSKISHVVVTSATLRSLNNFQRMQELSGLSVVNQDRFVTLDSPFDHLRQGKLILPQMRTEPHFTEELQHMEEMAAIFRTKITEAVAEGVLVLFASMRAMQLFLTHLPDLRLQLLVQGEKPRSRLIALHRERVEGGQQSILVGLQSFAEGLDLKGKLLTQVHIHKIAFPPVDSPVILTEAEWLKSQHRYPFYVQSLPGASFTLIQQVGRLIRSHQCFGEIIIYDRRLLTKSYGKKLLAALPVLPIEQPLLTLLPSLESTANAVQGSGSIRAKKSINWR